MQPLLDRHVAKAGGVAGKVVSAGQHTFAIMITIRGVPDLRDGVIGPGDSAIDGHNADLGAIATCYRYAFGVGVSMERFALPQGAIGLPANFCSAGKEPLRLVFVVLRLVDGLKRLLELIGETACFAGSLQPRGESFLKEGNRKIAEAVIRAERFRVTGGGDHELAFALVVIDAGYPGCSDALLHRALPLAD